MQKARRHPEGLRPLVSVWFQDLFHSVIHGSFHLCLTVLVHYRSLRSIQPYRMVPAVSRKIPLVPRYSGYYLSSSFTCTGLSPSLASFPMLFYFGPIQLCSPTTPARLLLQVWALPRSLATTYGIIFLFSPPTGTQMFQFPAFQCFRTLVLQTSGLPHSDIYGSRSICNSPQLFAAYHVFHLL